MIYDTIMRGKTPIISALTGCIAVKLELRAVYNNNGEQQQSQS